jgi:hypothetical protein
VLVGTETLPSGRHSAGRHLNPCSPAVATCQRRCPGGGRRGIAHRRACILTIALARGGALQSDHTSPLPRSMAGPFLPFARPRGSGAVLAPRWIFTGAAWQRTARSISRERRSDSRRDARRVTAGENDRP